MPTTIEAASPTAISQIAINVRDLNRATAFYRDVLRLPFLFDAPDMAFFSCGDVRLMLAVPGEARFDHPASIIYYNVTDLDDAYTHCTSHGAATERAPHKVHEGEGFELWMAFVRDSEDNVLALVTQRVTAGAGSEA